MKKALIIGAAGFVGGYLTEHLARDKGWTVVSTKLENEVLRDPEAVSMDLNVLDFDAVLRALNDVRADCVFHLAAQSSVAASWKNPYQTINININGAVNLLEALRVCECAPRVLLIGSAEEYGIIRPEEVPVGEETPVHPANYYAMTKACQNMLGAMHHSAYGADAVMVRAFNHIGPHQAPAFAVSSFCKQVADIEAGRQEPVIRVGDLSAKRDFTDVRDIVRAYGLLAEKGQAGQTYNVGSGRCYEMSDILKLILAEAKCRVDVETDPDRLRPSDVPVIQADISKLTDATGWRPEIPIEQTVKDCLEYWRGKPITI